MPEPTTPAPSAPEPAAAEPLQSEAAKDGLFEAEETNKPGTLTPTGDSSIDALENAEETPAEKNRKRGLLAAETRKRNRELQDTKGGPAENESAATPAEVPQEDSLEDEAPDESSAQPAGADPLFESSEESGNNSSDQTVTVYNEGMLSSGLSSFKRQQEEALENMTQRDFLFYLLGKVSAYEK